MTRLSLLLLAVGMASGVSAQTRLLVGPSGGSGLGNANLGIATSVEVPFAHHFELDASNVYSPLFSHPSAGGSGYTMQTKGGGIVWATKNHGLGLTSSIEYSSYQTTTVKKWGGYQILGPIFRLKLLDVPTRLDLQYIREFHNGVYGGIESNRIQGARIGVTGRIGSTGPVTWRMSEAFVIARGLNQGNSACDGEGIRNPVLSPCQRSSFIGGSVQIAIQMEWSRHRASDGDLF